MKGRLLLVDDNADFLDSTKDVLEDAGYSIMTAQNGEEALSLFLDRTFDVVLMDIKMPGLNGVDTFLRMKERDPKVRVILCTAYSVTDLMQKARREGVCEILNKPLNISRLLHLIEDIRKKNRDGYVLIVDDDHTMCDSLRDGLEQEGFRVATAFEGAEALRKVEKDRFDILLLDMKLPGMNGLEVYRKVKKIQPHIVTIIITGYQAEYSDLVSLAISESAYTCINKPMNMKRLLGLLDDVLAKNGGRSTKPHRAS
ncbi:MAG: response regulator [Desulfobacteraceae bacterium]|nr:MAG: response regulator [Desulfobacteraceae bacterium]